MAVKIRVSSIYKSMALMGAALICYFLRTHIAYPFGGVSLFKELSSEASQRSLMQFLVFFTRETPQQPKNYQMGSADLPVAQPRIDVHPQNSKICKISRDPSLEGKRLILAWTSLTKKKPLWSIKPYSFSKCEYNNCVITNNRTQLDQADLLLFSIRQLKKLENSPINRPYVTMFDPSDMPPYHFSDQTWMNINQESPVYTLSDEELSSLDDTFNLTVTYSLDSDFSLAYIPTIQKKEDRSRSIDYSAGKTKMALWFVSHCDASSGRDEYVKALQDQGIEVDVFGKCNGKSDGCAPSDTICYTEMRRKYRFYLALENSICSEYITEKFWNTLTSSAYNIPIALGATLAEYKEFAPPDSYIHTRNFTGVAALAEYMKKIASDDDLFNGYHKWRADYEVVQRTDGKQLHCYMCEAANKHMDGQPKIKHLSNYWSRKRLCDQEREPTGLS